MFDNIKIRSLIWFSSAFLVLVALLTGVLGVYSTETSVQVLKNISLQDQRNSATLVAIRLQMETNRSQLLQALQHNPQFDWHKLHDHPLDIHYDFVNASSKESQRLWQQYLASVTQAEERRLAEEWYAKSEGLGLAIIQRAMEHVRNNQWNQAEDVLIKQVNPTYRIADASLKNLHDLRAKQSELQNAQVEKTLDITHYGMLGMAVLAVILTALVAALLLRVILQPLQRALEIASNVAAGDLSATIENRSQNEFGHLLEALGKMRTNLARIVADVHHSTEAISTASGQIASGNLDLSHRTEQQAGSLEETAASMEELTGTVRQNYEHACQANQLAISASEVALKGGSVVSQVVQTMGSINESSRKIVDIIGVIDGIAFQTNILALNAAVEAARAGEQGRGFAVVAAEVRSLAQRSAAAAKEIKTLIGNSVESVESGSRLVDQAGVTMQEIVESIGRVTDIMGEITSASQEQTAGIDQINEAVTQMDAITQQNAAQVEEAAAAAESLRAQAGRLLELVSVFKLDAQTAINTALQTSQIKSLPAKPVSATKLPTRTAPKKIALPKPAPRATLATANAGWEEF